MYQSFYLHFRFAFQWSIASLNEVSTQEEIMEFANKIFLSQLKMF
jgi:hypothetical protein